MSKWYFIGMGLFFGIMAASLAIGEYQKGQCRQTGITAGKSAEEITKICR